MALVNISDFNGDIVTNTVMESLELIGVINKLNINGYHLYISGVHDKTPKGKVDDTPSKHIITIDRNKFIKKVTKSEFNRLKDSIDDIVNIIEDQENFNLDFWDENNKQIRHEISHDNSGYIWYKHEVKFEVEKSILETTESYVKRIFKDIADYVISTFEYMEGN